MDVGGWCTFEIRESLVLGPWQDTMQNGSCVAKVGFIVGNSWRLSFWSQRLCGGSYYVCLNLIIFATAFKEAMMVKSWDLTVGGFGDGWGRFGWIGVFFRSFNDCNCLLGISSFFFLLILFFFLFNRNPPFICARVHMMIIHWLGVRYENELLTMA